MAEIYVCSDTELKDGDVPILHLDRFEIGLYRHDGAYFAYRNHCPHQGGPACEGVMRPRVVDVYAPDKTYVAQTYDHGDPHIVCPWHGWEYKLRTGVCVPDPGFKLKLYDVAQRDGGLYVVV